MEQIRKMSPEKLAEIAEMEGVIESSLQQPAPDFLLEKTKRGLPAIWETGGAGRNTGKSQVIAGRNGLPKKSIYVPRGGHLACGAHALFVAEVGDIIITASHHREDFTIKVARIEKIVEVDNGRPQPYSALTFGARTVLVSEFSHGQWSTDCPEELKPAIEVAMDKALCYHCREPFYIAA